LQVAEELLDLFKDGIYLVELAPVTDSALIIPAIAGTLQVREAPGTPLLFTLKQHLQARTLLLVLDNFEQVLAARSVLAELLTACPRLALLVTSRSPLRLHGEYEYAVSPLSLPDPSQLSPARHLSVDRLSQYGSVALFVQRARAVNPDFELTESNSAAVVEVCRRVDALPLAIELVAAHSKLLPPQSILARLTHPLRLLRREIQEPSTRHQTMRDTIEWSYNLLSEREQRLFRRMSVFVGGIFLRAAEAVCNDAGEITIAVDHPLAIEVLEGIEALVDKSLLQKLDKGDGRDPRLLMLETVRDYAREKLQQSAEEAAVQRRFALYFMRLAEAAEPHLTGSKQEDWLERLEGEYDNIRAALRWAVEVSSNVEEAVEPTQPIDIALRTAGAMWRLWLAKGYFTEGREELQRLVMRAALLDSSPDGRARALNGASVMAFRQGEYISARSLADDALVLSREVADTRSTSDALNNIGSAAYGQGDYSAAGYHFQQSLELKRELGDEVGVSNAFGNLGVIAYTEGEYATARALFEQSLALKREIGDKAGVSSALSNLGLVAYVERNYPAARSFYEESLVLRTLGDKWGKAMSLNNLGLVAYMEGDYSTAYSLCAESLALKREIGDKGGTATSLAALGEIAVATGKPDLGVRLLGASDALFESIGAPAEPGIRISYELAVASARTQLGDELFERAMQAGRAMALEEALELANFHLETPTGQPTRQSKRPGGLTARESEVTALVARGLSNEEIARQLVLSERTVEMHVSNALHKLGLAARTQLAAWAIHNGLGVSE
jgi:non-specific serine/threonine protein kinase